MHICWINNNIIIKSEWIIQKVIVDIIAGIKCWNPAFDVTPARLITGGIVTELGVFAPHQLKDALLQHAAWHLYFIYL